MLLQPQHHRTRSSLRRPFYWIPFHILHVRSIYIDHLDSKPLLQLPFNLLHDSSPQTMSQESKLSSTANVRAQAQRNRDRAPLCRNRTRVSQAPTNQEVIPCRPKVPTYNIYELSIREGSEWFWALDMLCQKRCEKSMARRSLVI
jgi:hypothetical protein